jgi:hypothetical protein
MKTLAYRKPKVAEVSRWDCILTSEREYDWKQRPDATAYVYSAENFYDYYKVVADGRTKYFFGEMAYWDYKHYLSDLGYPE